MLECYKTECDTPYTFAYTFKILQGWLLENKNNFMNIYFSPAIEVKFRIGASARMHVFKLYLDTWTSTAH